MSGRGLGTSLSCQWAGLENFIELGLGWKRQRLATFQFILQWVFSLSWEWPGLAELDDILQWEVL